MRKGSRRGRGRASQGVARAGRALDDAPVANLRNGPDEVAETEDQRALREELTATPNDSVQLLHTIANGLPPPARDAVHRAVIDPATAFLAGDQPAFGSAMDGAYDSLARNLRHMIGDVSVDARGTLMTSCAFSDFIVQLDRFKGSRNAPISAYERKRAKDQLALEESRRAEAEKLMEESKKAKGGQDKAKDDSEHFGAGDAGVGEEEDGTEKAGEDEEVVMDQLEKGGEVAGDLAIHGLDRMDETEKDGAESTREEQVDEVVQKGESEVHEESEEQAMDEGEEREDDSTHGLKDGEEQGEEANLQLYDQSVDSNGNVEAREEKTTETSEKTGEDDVTKGPEDIEIKMDENSIESNEKEIREEGEENGREGGDAVVRENESIDGMEKGEDEKEMIDGRKGEEERYTLDSNERTEDSHSTGDSNDLAKEGLDEVHEEPEDKSIRASEHREEEPHGELEPMDSAEHRDIHEERVEDHSVGDALEVDNRSVDSAERREQEAPEEELSMGAPARREEESDYDGREEDSVEDEEQGDLSFVDSHDGMEDEEERSFDSNDEYHYRPRENMPMMIEVDENGDEIVPMEEEVETTYCAEELVTEEEINGVRGGMVEGEEPYGRMEVEEDEESSEGAVRVRHQRMSSSGSSSNGTPPRPIVTRDIRGGRPSVQRAAAAVAGRRPIGGPPAVAMNRMPQGMPEGGPAASAEQQRRH